MPGSRRKIVSHQRKKKFVSSTNVPREVAPSDVIESLWRLFGHLGIDVAHPVIKELRSTGLTSAAHTLYPYAAAIGGLLTRWYRDPDYLDDQGNPAPVKFQGPGPSFRSLAQRAVPSIDESYLLSELERLGVVIIDANKFVHVTTRSFPMYKDKRFAAQHTLTALHDFIRTLNHNIGTAESDSEQLFHRIAWNGNLDARDIAALNMRMKHQAQSFLESSDNWLIGKSALKPRTKGSRVTTNKTEVSVGVYLSVKEL